MLRNTTYPNQDSTAAAHVPSFYEIRSKPGEGGKGEMYLAQDTRLDRKVALKILPADVAAHQERVRCFVQEERQPQRSKLRP